MEAPEVTAIRANCDNKEYVLKAVSEQGKLLEWASDSLRDDEEVVKTALENDGEAMEFASDRLNGFPVVFRHCMNRNVYCSSYTSS